MYDNIKVLYAYIEAQNGYGISAKSFISALQKIEGIDIDLLPLNKPNIQFEKQLQDYYDYGIVHISTASVIQDFQANGYLKMAMSRCRKKLQYVLWETDRLPKSYIEFYKTDFFSGFICPSDFCVQLIKKTGRSSKNVFYVPITVGDDINYHPDKRIARPDVFTVLTVAQMSVRKAIDLSVCAVATAFAGCPDVQYYLKLGEKIDGQEPDVLVKANVQRMMISNPPSIFIIDQHLNDNEMEKLYLSSNCYLHMSRGEGFAITPLVALNYGLPVIYSNWSAHAEYLSKDPRSTRIEGRIDLIHSMDSRFGFEPEMKWFEPSLSDAVDALRAEYSRWKMGKDKYKVADVAKSYRTDAVIPFVADVFEIKNPTIKNEKTIDGMTFIEVT